MEPHLQTLMNAPWDNENFYKEWLAQSYHYTRHSIRMLAFSAGCSHPEEKSYFQRSLKHIREEQGHEQIAVNDLKTLGGSIENFMEKGVTRALWEPQFYKIQKDPVSLLGYILALECLAVFKFSELNDILVKRYGDKANRFVHIHAEDDPHHVTEALAQIELCSDVSKKLIQANFDQTCDLYSCLINNIIATTS